MALSQAGLVHAQQTAARERARAELVALQSGLESYRQHHGVYPLTSGAAVLWDALSGRSAPDGAPGRGRPYVDLATLRWAHPDNATPENQLLDPWGEAYRFVVPAGREGVGFVLYSAGPDGREIAPATEGQPNPAHPDNRDNLTVVVP